MLLSDAALSAHEWYFRTISAIRGNLGQIKLLVFLLGQAERVIVKCWLGCFFFFLLPIKTEATAGFFHKGRLPWVMLISESKPPSSDASYYLLKSAAVVFGL